jgi:hypothetical protein
MIETNPSDPDGNSNGSLPLRQLTEPVPRIVEMSGLKLFSCLLYFLVFDDLFTYSLVAEK